MPAAQLPAAHGAMQRMVAASRAEQGCLHYSYAADLLDRGLVHVKEMWTDEDALNRHFASAHIATWRSSWSSLGIGERKLVLYTVAGARPI